MISPSSTLSLPPVWRARDSLNPTGTLRIATRRSAACQSGPETLVVHARDSQQVLSYCNVQLCARYCRVSARHIKYRKDSTDRGSHCTARAEADFRAVNWTAVLQHVVLGPVFRAMRAALDVDLEVSGNF